MKLGRLLRYVIIFSGLLYFGIMLLTSIGKGAFFSELGYFILSFILILAVSFFEIFLPESLKDLFIDSLKAFENYLKLSGYEFRFSFGNSDRNKLGFKFTVTENPNNISKDEIRVDIKKFLGKIQNGGEIKDIPMLLNEVEHYKVLTSPAGVSGS
jgi:hypothetical protein